MVEVLKHKQKSDVAVALHYESGMLAPIVAATGNAELAKQLSKIARRYGIPEVCAPELAFRLSTLKFEEAVPEILYSEVAEALAKAELKRRKTGKQ